MISPARSRCAVYLPIDGLIASLEDALAEIAEIESRRGPATQERGGLAQIDRLRCVRQYVECALVDVRDYAKGPRR